MAEKLLLPYQKYSYTLNVLVEYNALCEEQYKVK